MRNPIPPRPTGSDSEAFFMQAIWDACFGRASKFVNSSTVQWTETNDGISAQASAGGAGGASLIQCVVTSLFYGTDDDGDTYDYIGVTPFDILNNAFKGSEILCSKSMPAWSPSSEVIDGITVNYIYSGDNTRVASSDIGTNENHVVHSRYININVEPIGSINQYLIYIAKIKGGQIIKASDPAHAGQPVNYQEIHPCRYWALGNTLP